MYVVVVGGGKVGYYLPKTLVNEVSEVLLTEKEAAKVRSGSERVAPLAQQGRGAAAASPANGGVGRGACWL